MLQFKNESVWFEIWYSWAQVSFQKQVNNSQIVDQMIWLNSNIKNNGQVFCCYDYIDQGVWYIKDLIDPNTKVWFTSTEFQEK